MQLSLFQIIEALLVSIIFLYLLYYVYGLFFDKNYQPKAWKEAARLNKLPKQLQKLERKYPDKVRFFNFWFQVERLKKEKVSGDFAELGVYKGDSAQLIHCMDHSRDFHLFDTFEGFQDQDLEVETGKAATYTPHNFADTHIDTVKSKLNSDAFHFHKGYFPDSTRDLGELKFALVNMDADLYNPTKSGLEYFYPRLTPGGIILIHDYNPDWPGIVKAVDEFVAGIGEALVVLPDQDSTAMILKNKT